MVPGPGPPEPGWANAGKLVSTHRASKAVAEEKKDFIGLNALRKVSNQPQNKAGSTKLLNDNTLGQRDRACLQAQGVDASGLAAGVNLPMNWCALLPRINAGLIHRLFQAETTSNRGHLPCHYSAIA